MSLDGHKEQGDLHACNGACYVSLHASLLSIADTATCAYRKQRVEEAIPLSDMSLAPNSYV